MPYKDPEKQRKFTNNWYQQNKVHHIANVIRRKQEVAELIREAKNKPCMDCGRSYPSYVMDFDHREDKSFGISMSWKTKGRQQVIAEIAKCDVVCSNCHRIRSWNSEAYGPLV